MNFGDYDRTLNALKTVGRLRCCYVGDWPDNTCDCKFGGPILQPHPTYGDSLPHEVLGEQTGCPELRTIYLLLSTMGEETYNEILTKKYAENLEIAKNFFEERDAS